MKLTKIFESSNLNWIEDKERNELFLRSRLHYLNLLFKEYGIISIARAYEEIGYPRTKESCLFGWNIDDGDCGIRAEIEPIDGTSDFLITFDANLLFRPWER